jgi:ketosteroid isomerase-like protein
MIRTNEQRAERARHAYNAVSHEDIDGLTNLCDLVTDLLHFADVLAWESRDDGGLEDETPGQFVARMAQYHYAAELAVSDAAWASICPPQGTEHSV